MTGKKSRKLTVDGVIYRWNVSHRHVLDVIDGRPHCSEMFWAYREGFRNHGCRMRFPESAEHGPGFPSQSGVVSDYRPPRWSLNLNRPAVARLLIELATGAGWVSDASGAPFIVDNAYDFVRGRSPAVPV